MEDFLNMEIPMTTSTGFTPSNIGSEVFVKQPQEVFENALPGIVVKSETEESFKKEQPLEMSELLFDSAKEEGFEESLMHLANGDFDSKEEGLFESEKIEESIGENEFEDNAMQHETLSLSDKIGMQERKIDEILERSHMLSDKLNSLEEANRLRSEAMLEFAALVLLMKESGEDSEEETGMVETLVSLLERIIIAFFVPEDPGADKAQKSDHESKPKKNTGKLIEDLRSVLSRKNMDGTLPQDVATEMRPDSEFSLAA